MQCLQTIYEGNTNNIEIIVVDNDSNDTSEALITTAYPKVLWLQMGYNSGFARANNAGIKAATGNIVLLLNSDTLNINNAIYKCFERLNTDSYIACGVQLLHEDRSPQISGSFFMTGGLNHLMALPYLGRLIRWIGLKGGVKVTNVPKTTTTVEVDWINGAFLMVKKEAIAKAGLMDEDFFLYSEETEWCSRLNRFGKMCIYGDLNIVHLEGGTSAGAFASESRGYQVWSDKKGYQIMISHFVRMRKQFGVFWYLFHVAANFFTVPVYFLIVVFKTLLLSNAVKNEWKDWLGYTKNVFASLIFMPAIIANRKHFYKVL